MILLFRLLLPAKSQANRLLLLIAFGVLSGRCDKLWIQDLRATLLGQVMLVPRGSLRGVTRQPRMP